MQLRGHADLKGWGIRTKILNCDCKVPRCHTAAKRYHEHGNNEVWSDISCFILCSTILFKRINAWWAAVYHMLIMIILMLMVVTHHQVMLHLPCDEGYHDVCSWLSLPRLILLVYTRITWNHISSFGQVSNPPMHVIGCVDLYWSSGGMCVW